MATPNDFASIVSDIYQGMVENGYTGTEADLAVALSALSDDNGATTKWIDLGASSAYAIAVEHGYTGTEDEWIALLMDTTQNAQIAQESADSAAESAASAKQSEEAIPAKQEEALQAIASAESDALQSVNTAGTTQTGNVNTAGQAQVQAVNSAGTTQIGLVEQEGSDQKDVVTAEGEKQTQRVSNQGILEVQAVADEGTRQTGLVTSEGTTQVARVTAEGTTQVGLVTTEGTTQVGNVSDEGASQVAAVQAKGDEVIDSIPQDYSALTQNVSALNSAITLGELTDKANDSILYNHLALKKEVIDSNSGEVDTTNMRAWSDETYYECLQIDQNKSTLTVPAGYLLYCYYYDADKVYKGTNNAQSQTIKINTEWKYVRFGIRNSGYTQFDLTNEIKNSVVVVLDKSCTADVAGANGIVFERGYISSGTVTTGYDFYATAYRSGFINADVLKAVKIPVGYKMLVFYYDAEKTYKTQAIYNAGTVVLATYSYVRLCIRDANNAVFTLDSAILDNFVFYGNSLETLLASDICPVRTNAESSNGINYTPVIYGIIVDGTAITTSYYNIFINQTALPDKFYPGKSYYFEFNGFVSRLVLHVRYYNGSEWQYLYNDYKSTKITIPADAVGLQIRLSVNTGYSFDHQKVSLRVFDADSIIYQDLISHNIPRPMLTIIYDDGEDEFKSYILPIIQAKKVPISTAIITEYVGTSGIMDYNDITTCYKGGAEVLCHAIAHTETEWDTMGKYDVAATYRATLYDLINHGYNPPDAIVYSAQSHTYPTCYNAAKDSMEYGIAAAAASITNAVINPINGSDPYSIRRCYSDGADLDTLKGWIDALVSAGSGWQIWMRHNTRARASMGIEDTAQDDADKLAAAIDYAISRRVSIVTVRLGLKAYFGK